MAALVVFNFEHLLSAWLTHILCYSVATKGAVKQSWADDVDDLGKQTFIFSSPLRHYSDQEIDEFKPSDTIDANGIRTIIEYTTNDAGKKVKV